MIEQRRAEEEQQRAMKRSATAGSSSPEKEEEGYWAYMQRQMQERTQNLNIMGDSMNRVEENSSNWADDVNKFVNKQKKKAVMGCKSPLSCTLRRSKLTPTSHWEQNWILKHIVPILIISVFLLQRSP